MKDQATQIADLVDDGGPGGAPDELPAEPSPASPTESTKERRARLARDRRTRKAQAAAVRQRRTAERDAARERARADVDEGTAPATARVSDEPLDDDPEVAAYQRFVREQMEAPLQSHRDLALLLGRLQMGLHSIAQETAYAESVMALQWTNGVAPTKQCLISCALIWPWMHRRGIVVRLAEQSDSIIALVGAFTLLAPALGPAWSAFKSQRDAAAGAEVAARDQVVELRPEQPKAPGAAAAAGGA